MYINIHIYPQVKSNKNWHINTVCIASSPSNPVEGDVYYKSTFKYVYYTILRKFKQDFFTVRLSKALII